jgi:hypothetical protein
VTLPRLARAIVAGGLLAFTFSFDDFYTSFFLVSTGETTLPVFIFASLRFGVTPAITAKATMISPSAWWRSSPRNSCSAALLRDERQRRFPAFEKGGRSTQRAPRPVLAT